MVSCPARSRQFCRCENIRDRLFPKSNLLELTFPAADLRLKSINDGLAPRFEKQSVQSSRRLRSKRVCGRAFEALRLNMAETTATKKEQHPIGHANNNHEGKRERSVGQCNNRASQQDKSNSRIGYCRFDAVGPDVQRPLRS
jgi:hypothetical protein